MSLRTFTDDTFPGESDRSRRLASQAMMQSAVKTAIARHVATDTAGKQRRVARDMGAHVPAGGRAKGDAVPCNADPVEAVATQWAQKHQRSVRQHGFEVEALRQRLRDKETDLVQLRHQLDVALQDVGTTTQAGKDTEAMLTAQCTSLEAEAVDLRLSLQASAHEHRIEMEELRRRHGSEPIGPLAAGLADAYRETDHPEYGVSTVPSEHHIPAQIVLALALRRVQKLIVAEKTIWLDFVDSQTPRESELDTFVKILAETAENRKTAVDDLMAKHAASGLKRSDMLTKLKNTSDAADMKSETAMKRYELGSPAAQYVLRLSHGQTWQEAVDAIKEMYVEVSWQSMPNEVGLKDIIDLFAAEERIWVDFVKSQEAEETVLSDFVANLFDVANTRQADVHTFIAQHKYFGIDSTDTLSTLKKTSDAADTRFEKVNTKYTVLAPLRKTIYAIKRQYYDEIESISKDQMLSARQVRALNATDLWQYDDDDTDSYGSEQQHGFGMDPLRQRLRDKDAAIARLRQQVDVLRLAGITAQAGKGTEAKRTAQRPSLEAEAVDLRLSLQASAHEHRIEMEKLRRRNGSEPIGPDAAGLEDAAASDAYRANIQAKLQAKLALTRLQNYIAAEETIWLDFVESQKAGSFSLDDCPEVLADLQAALYDAVHKRETAVDDLMDRLAIAALDSSEMLHNLQYTSHVASKRIERLKETYNATVNGTPDSYREAVDAISEQYELPLELPLESIREGQLLSAEDVSNLSLADLVDASEYFEAASDAGTEPLSESDDRSIASSDSAELESLPSDDGTGSADSSLGTLHNDTRTTADAKSMLYMAIRHLQDVLNKLRDSLMLFSLLETTRDQQQARYTLYDTTSQFYDAVELCLKSLDTLQTAGIVTEAFVRRLHQTIDFCKVRRLKFWVEMKLAETSITDSGRVYFEAQLALINDTPAVQEVLDLEELTLPSNWDELLVTFVREQDVTGFEHALVLHTDPPAVDSFFEEMPNFYSRKIGTGALNVLSNEERSMNIFRDCLNDCWHDARIGEGGAESLLERLDAWIESCNETDSQFARHFTGLVVQLRALPRALQAFRLRLTSLPTLAAFPAFALKEMFRKDVHVAMMHDKIMVPVYLQVFEAAEIRDAVSFLVYNFEGHELDILHLLKLGLQNKYSKKLLVPLIEIAPSGLRFIGRLLLQDDPLQYGDSRKRALNWDMYMSMLGQYWFIRAYYTTTTPTNNTITIPDGNKQPVVLQQAESTNEMGTGTSLSIEVLKDMKRAFYKIPDSVPEYYFSSCICDPTTTLKMSTAELLTIFSITFGNKALARISFIRDILRCSQRLDPKRKKLALCKNANVPMCQDLRGNFAKALSKICTQNSWGKCLIIQPTGNITSSELESQEVNSSIAGSTNSNSTGYLTYHAGDVFYIYTQDAQNRTWYRPLSLLKLHGDIGCIALVRALPIVVLVACPAPTTAVHKTQIGCSAYKKGTFVTSAAAAVRSHACRVSGTGVTSVAAPDTQVDPKIAAYMDTIRGDVFGAMCGHCDDGAITGPIMAQLDKA